MIEKNENDKKNPINKKQTDYAYKDKKLVSCSWVQLQPFYFSDLFQPASLSFVSMPSHLKWLVSHCLIMDWLPSTTVVSRKKWILIPRTGMGLAFFRVFHYKWPWKMKNFLSSWAKYQRADNDKFMTSISRQKPIPVLPP